MPQLINVPGMGIVKFPDGMSDGEISSAIQRNLQSSLPPDPLGDYYRNEFAKQKAIAAEKESTSIAGSFGRAFRDNTGAGIGATLATGAALALAPETVGLSALAIPLIAGIGGGYAGGLAQEQVDPMTAERERQRQIDEQYHPIASYAGAMAPMTVTMKPGLSSFKNAVAPMGRSAAQDAAIVGARMNIGTGAGIGAGLSAGMSAIQGQPIDPMRVVGDGLVGAIFNEPNRLGRALGHSSVAPIGSIRAQEAQPAGYLPAPRGEVVPYTSEPEVIQGRPYQRGRQPSPSGPIIDILPSNAGLISDRPPSSGLLGNTLSSSTDFAFPELPLPVAGQKESRPVVDIRQRDAEVSQMNSLNEELVANRARREELVSKFKDRGQPINKGIGRRMIDILDARAKELSSKVEALRNEEIITPPAPSREIIELDNRTFGTKPADRLSLTNNEPNSQGLAEVQGQAPPQMPVPEVPAIEARPPLIEPAGGIQEATRLAQAQAETPLIPTGKESLQVGTQAEALAVPVTEDSSVTQPSAVLPGRNYARAGNIISEPGQRDFLDFIQENPINVPEKAKRVGGEWDGFDEFRQGLPPVYKSELHFTKQGGRGIAEVADAAYRERLITEPTGQALMEKYRETIATRKQVRTTGDLNPLEIKARQSEVRAPRQAKDFDAALTTNRRSRAGEKVVAGDFSEGETFQFQGENFKVTKSDTVEGFDGPEGLVVLQDHDKFGTQVVDASQPLRISGKAEATVWSHEKDQAAAALSRRQPADSPQTVGNKDGYAHLQDEVEMSNQPAEEIPSFLNQRQKAESRQELTQEPLTLKAHESDAEIKSEKAATRDREKIAEGLAKPLKGTAGDTTADIFGEGDTPLFNERRDQPPSAAEKGGVVKGLKAHQQEVRDWINSEKKSGRLNMLPVDILGAQVYDATLSVVIKAVEAGQSVNAAVKAGIAHIKASRQLTKGEQADIEKRLRAEANSERVKSNDRDSQFKVEMPKVAQELEGRGISQPTVAQIIKELTAKFPEQTNYIRQNSDRLFDEMIFSESKMKGKSKSAQEFIAWTDASMENAAKIGDWAKRGTPIRDIGSKLRLFNSTYFGGIGSKTHLLAEGGINGKESPSLKKFANKLFGLRSGSNGIHEISTDSHFKNEATRLANKLEGFKRELHPFLSKKPKREVEAFYQRASDHMTDPARDGELAKQPELKKLVDQMIALRREVYDIQKANGVDIGDAGPRSLSRKPVIGKVIGNEKEFVAQAEKAYRATWAEEINQLNVKRNAARAVGDAAEVAKLTRKIAEVNARDANDDATKYLYALQSTQLGLSPDGSDLINLIKGSPSNKQSRVLGPEADQFLGKFYERNIVKLMMSDINDGMRAAAIAKTLAGKNPDGTIDPFGGWKSLRKEMKAEGNSESIPMAASLLKSHFNLGGHESPKIRKALEIAHTHTQIGRLAHALVSSLTEPVLIGIRHGGGIPAMAGAFKGTAESFVRRVRNASPSEWQIIADFMGSTTGGLDAMIGAASHMDGYAGGFGSKLVSSFHHKTLLTDWTNATHETALRFGHAHILAELKTAKAGGTYSNLSRKLLNEVGISGKEIDGVLKFSEAFQTSADKPGMLSSNDPMAKKYRDALHLFRNSASLEPTRGSLPQYKNTPIGMLFYQLSSFLHEFHDKVTMRQVRHLSAAWTGGVEIDGVPTALNKAEVNSITMNAVQGVLAIAATSYAVQRLREVLFKDPVRVMKDKKRSAAEIEKTRVYSALSRTGFLGPYDVLFNAITGARYQRDPSSVLHGAALGGAFQMFQHTVQLLNESYEDSINDRTTPRSNVTARKFGRDVSDMIVTPAINAAAATAPGRAVGAIIQAGSSPAFREVITKTIGGPMRIQK